MNRYILSILLVTALVLPLIMTALTITINNTSNRGRVTRYTAYINITKEPEDDPFDAYIGYIFPSIGSYGISALGLTSGSIRSVSATVNIHDSLDILTQTRITSLFSYTSETSATQQLRVGDYYEVFYIPSRTYQPGVQYRWVITIPGYISPNLSLSSFPIPVSETVVVASTAHTASCTYLSGGQPVSSSTGLGISRSVTRFSESLVLLIYVISFDTSWIGRLVTSCSIYTTESGVINGVNTLLTRTGQRTVAAGRLYIAIVDNLNTVIQQGDRIEIWAYYSAPSNI